MIISHTEEATLQWLAHSAAQYGFYLLLGQMGRIQVVEFCKPDSIASMSMSEDKLSYLIFFRGKCFADIPNWQDAVLYLAELLDANFEVKL